MTMKELGISKNFLQPGYFCQINPFKKPTDIEGLDVLF